MIWLEHFFQTVNVFFVCYLIGYASYLFISIIVGGLHLYKHKQMLRIRNELKTDYYVPISLIVPAHNEEVTIIESITSMLWLDYRLYEIIIVDDGSTDHTTEVLLDHFHLIQVNRPIQKRVHCNAEQAIYEGAVEGVKITLVRKENGGKGDALNMGINASSYPYFLCIDADSLLQKDSLEKIAQPLMEDDKIIAVAGMIRVAQCVKIDKGIVKSYHLPWNPIVCMQVLEYDRSFLASRIFMNYYNGNLIISGAFGLFKKDIVIACGGYDLDTLGEDMELAVKLHVFAHNNAMDYRIHYESNAVCWSQVPPTIRDLVKQRRRWHIGLFQSMMKYKTLFLNHRYGLISFFSYMYYLLYELLSPFIEVFGVTVMICSAIFGFINIQFMLIFYLLYALYGALLTLTAFFQRVYTYNIKLSFIDVVKAVVMCIIENLYLRFLLSFIRATSFIGYKRHRKTWGKIQREKHNA